MSFSLDRRRFLVTALAGAAIVAFDPLRGGWVTAAEAAEGTPRGAVAVPDLDGQLSTDPAVLAAAADDFGHLVHRTPLAVLRPGSTPDEPVAFLFAIPAHDRAADRPGRAGRRQPRPVRAGPRGRRHALPGRLGAVQPARLGRPVRHATTRPSPRPRRGSTRAGCSRPGRASSAHRADPPCRRSVGPRGSADRRHAGVTKPDRSRVPGLFTTR
jgi:hypothetical protein